MKVNESKKFERAKIQKLKQEYLSLTKRVSTIEGAFTALECRHRKGGMCGHGRQAISKYPGHTPGVAFCAVGACPL